ncbi:uncharacterized protein LOC128724088 [Anopheles nili]|uniref:uncharacterized protein LOC128724088 n=1 Tax=Anopheles nili TaxID=185578 RepID=UPI00237AEF17|nr:uncharacterized protein LOC128724088 [Anopheles nili]
MLPSIAAFQFKCVYPVCYICNWNPSEEGAFMMNHIPSTICQLNVEKLNASSLDVGLLYGRKTSVTRINIERSAVRSVFLPSFTRVISLTLERTKLSKITFELNNIHLESLSITKSRLTTVPSTIRHLTKLKILTISESRLQTVDLSSFGFFQHLQTMHLNTNFIKHLTAPSGQQFPSLTSFNAQRNHLKSIHMGIFNSMKQLEKLDLQRNELENVEGPIVSCKLKQILLSLNRLTDVLPSIVGFQFKCLYAACFIHNWNPTKEGTFLLQHVPATIGMLKLLQLQVSSIDVGLFYSKTSLLTYINIESSAVRSVFLPSFARAQSLRFERTKLSEITFEVNNTSLESLFIINSLLTTIPSTIGHLTQLGILVISESRLQIVDLSSFGTLQHLHVLQLHTNMIERLDLTESLRQKFPSLKTLNIQHNQLKAINMDVFRSIVGFQFKCAYTICAIHNWNPSEEGTFVLQHVPTTASSVKLVSLNVSSFDIGMLHEKLPFPIVVSIERCAVQSIYLPSFVRTTSLMLERTQISEITFEPNNTHLESLTISASWLTSVPTTIGHLQAVTIVKITDSPLETIDLSVFGTPPRLEQLHLNRNRIKRLELTHRPGHYFLNLRELNFQQNGLQSVSIDMFNSMKSLNRLDLSRNMLKHLQGSFVSASLQSVKFSRNHLAHLNCCRWNLASLTNFEIAFNNLKQLPACMGDAMPNLGFLLLASNCLLDDDGFWPNITHMKQLRSLTVTNNSLSSVVLTNFTVSLNSLEITNNKLRHLCIPHATGALAINAGCNNIEQFDPQSMSPNLWTCINQ